MFANPKNADERYLNNQSEYLGKVVSEKTSQQESERRVGEAFSTGYQQAADEIRNHVAKSEADLAAEDARMQESYKRTQAEFDDIKRRRQELSDTKIDPDRKWKNASSEQKIITGLARLVSGIASGATGRDPAKESWDRMIERDIDAQKTDIMNKSHGLQQEENLVARKYAQDRDMNSWYLAKKIEGKDVLQGKLKAIEATTSSEAAKEKANLAISKIEEEKLGLGMELQKSR
jgi:hypothetical protein